MNQENQPNQPKLTLVDNCRHVLSANYIRILRAYRKAKVWLTPRRAVLIISSATLATVLVNTLVFLWPKTIAFSYAGDNCFSNPTLLPRLITSKSSASYSLKMNTAAKIASYPVYSRTTCITASQAPSINSNESLKLALPGGVLQKRLTISLGKAPAIKLNIDSSKPVAASQPLAFSISQPDQLFGYSLTANSKSAKCKNISQVLSCDLNQLNLSQATKYSYTVTRVFGEKPVGTVLSGQFTTVDAVDVASSSITPNQTVYDSPKELKLALNKEIASIDSISLSNVSNDKSETLDIKTSTDGKILTISFNKPLPRSSSLKLVVNSIISKDGGYLTQPYNLIFVTSGGPKVVSTSIGTTRASQTAGITISFDTAILAGQDISQLFAIISDGNTVPASISRSEKSVTITPKSSLGKCRSFSVKVSEGLQNSFGITGNTAWQINSRTLCQSVFSIGTSVKGRDITAYSFGTGPSKIIFVGDTHGNEKSSTYTLNDWIDYLESNPGVIPSNRTIIIIPKLNPDGYAANTRTNANNVDLNRNFPANNWKSGVTEPDHTFLPTGGGITALSEPESKALADYVLGQSPRLVLTYHAKAGIVAPNGSGDTVSLAHTYANKSPVWFLANDQSSTVFDYDTTGAFEDWLNDKYSIPALLIELDTQAGNEFSGHRSAMQAMIQIP